MFYGKRSLLLLVLSSIGMSGFLLAFTSPDPIKDHLKMLFCTSSDCNNLDVASQKDLEAIEQESRSQLGHLFRMIYFGFESDREIVRDVVREYVQNRSYRYACFLGASHFEARTVAKKINSMIKKEEEFAKTRGTFSQFLGAALEYRTEKLLAEVRKQSVVSQKENECIDYCPSTDYSSDDDPCVSCAEVIAKNKRVFLPNETGSLRRYSASKMLYQSCGHFLCIGCAQQWFFNQNKDTCPFCRSTVNKSLLRSIVNSKNNTLEQEALLSHESSQYCYNHAPEGCSYHPWAQ